MTCSTASQLVFLCFYVLAIGVARKGSMLASQPRSCCHAFVVPMLFLKVSKHVCEKKIMYRKEVRPSVVIRRSMSLQKKKEKKKETKFPNKISKSIEIQMALTSLCTWQPIHSMQCRDFQTSPSANAVTLFSFSTFGTQILGQSMAILTAYS